ncbi:reverse transcriptase domain-containing protein [Tanacetum coccineum]
MREVYYHDWLSNPVMVKKHDGSWRMCVDFTDLNNACPHNCYPLLEIDWKVESLCGYPFKCFLDAYKGYHQIQMAEADEEKMAFHTPQGVYCYTKMPFGLKNARATYQRLVDKAFDKQVGQNLEVYVDDLVIKSHTKTELLRDIEETFRTLRKINMKLNPKKMYVWSRGRDVPGKRSGWVWGWFRLAAMVVVACGVRCGGGSDEGVVGVEWEMAAVGVDDEGGVYGGGAAAGGRSVVMEVAMVRLMVVVVLWCGDKGWVEGGKEVDQWWGRGGVVVLVGGQPESRRSRGAAPVAGKVERRGSWGLVITQMK